MLDFDRALCVDLNFAGTREWLVTNGIGGYASGTVAGILTRRYHALLVAALNPPLGRTLLVAKWDETVDYDGSSYPLFANRWAGGLLDPNGALHLERFHLEGTTPVWTYSAADALLEKRVWMQSGANTTYIRYELVRAALPLALTLKTLVNYRDHHANTHAGGWKMLTTSVEHGFKVDAFYGAVPFYVLSDHAQGEAEHIWQRDFFLSVEDQRGLDAYDDHLHVATFRVTLKQGESVTLVASTQPAPALDGAAAYAERRAYEGQLIVQGGQSNGEAWMQQLVLAADQFIVQRSLPDNEDGRSTLAGFPWFGDWGRDTMISLPGLTLVTGRYDVARRILRTFAHFVDQGMLPNRFPDVGEKPEYNTVDATLWYFEAIRAYYAATEDDDLLRELFPVLEEIVDWHRRGTRYNIHVDARDGLLYAGEPGVQLTWMDVKIGDRVITARIGKPIEINALWYNAQRIMEDFAHKLRKPAKTYEDGARQTEVGFARFWNSAAGYCYDVVDTPSGDNGALRPNQLFAVSLPHSPLADGQARGVVDISARRLLTSHGLRSLSPDDPAFVGRYSGDQRRRDSAYHQGTVWAWLLGPFVSAHLRVYRDPVQARSFLRPLIAQMASHGLGSISEIFDGSPPFAPHGCFAQAWSVAEVLRAWNEIQRVAQDSGLSAGV
jgi:predicted glycogen debranching enzyme